MNLPLFLSKRLENPSPSAGSLDQTLRFWAKCALDYSMAFVGLVLLSPFFLIIGIIIKRDSPGGVFFLAPRMGKGGKPFKMLKFRTMYENPESYAGPRVTCKGDKRITPFGCWLRDTKVNELPQLWNVLKGDMSLVGPRPEDPEIARDWPEEASQEILSVRPGITSPASILYHDEESLLKSNDVMGSYIKDILPDKMRLDRLYVRHQSFFTDIDIIFWTVVIIIPRLVRAPIPEGYLFAGPISRFIHRYVTWFVIDLISALISVAAVGFIWRAQVPFNWGDGNLMLLAIGLAFLFSGVNAIAGLNRIDWPRATVGDALALALSGSCVTLLLLILETLQIFHRWVPLPALPIPMFVTIGMVAFGGFFVTRYRWRILTSIASRWITWRRDRSGVGERIIIVGSGEGLQTATWLLNQERFLYAFTVVGIVDDDVLSKKDMRIDGCKILGRFSDLPYLVKKYDIGLIIFTMPSLPVEIKSYVFDQAKARSIRLIFLDKFLKLMNQQLIPKDIFESNLSSPVDNLEYLATHNEYTGLPNRYLFKYELKHSLAYAKRYNNNNLAVLTINLDDYRDIAKNLGPVFGKEVLRESTRRLVRCKRESDMLASLNDNQFALILENISDCVTVEMVSRRISLSLEEPYVVEGQVINVSANLQSYFGAKVCEEAHLIEDLPVGY